MPAPFRRKNSPVIRVLAKQPARFAFVQAVRLLERAAVFINRQRDDATRLPANPVGRFAPPATECVRLQSQLSLGFPEAEVMRVDKPGPETKRSQWRLVTNFLSLTGSMGVLPFHYTELLFQRLKQKDTALRQFLELFQHRTASLFYRASCKYRLPLAYERHHLHNRRRQELDAHSHLLRSLIGCGTEHITDGLPMPAESLLFFSGFLSQSIRSKTALEQTLTHYFAVPVQLQEFVGEWHELIDDVRSRLRYPGHPRGQNAQLGRSAILGGKGWFGQSKIRLKLGPLNQAQFQQFGPGTRALNELNQVVKLFIGAEVDAEYVLYVAREHIPNRIQLNRHKAPIIGWDTWLATRPLPPERKGETLAITVSSHRLH